MDNALLKQAANTVRGLAMDGVEAAKSGHPGMPMGAADYATTLFLTQLSHCPGDPAWPDRDRFVLSAGHGAMLAYSLLHLAGYDLPIEELARFRQLDSKAPGHPEYGHTPGIETTTGPLGQGCANAVGFAIAERMLAARFNTPEITVVDHYTYVICSDGDLMEGISHEAFALAGHLGLHKLIAIYDCNGITIEGKTALAYSDDVRKRFEAYHWNVLEIAGHDFDAIGRAFAAAREEKERPTIIIARTHIGFGSPNLQDSSKIHGEPMGPEEVKAAKRHLGLPEDRAFFVPPAVRAAFQERAAELEMRVSEWNARFKKWRAKNPDMAAVWNQAWKLALPADLAAALPEFSKPVATRAASGAVMQKLAAALPYLVGGSADLAPSTKTFLTQYQAVAKGAFAGRNFHFGIREHGMAGILNGMALHGGLRVFGSTFFVFVDYCKPSVRLSALMGLPVIYVFTHDSFYVGEDGPTHEPVEQIASLRCIPNMTVIRPADATETAAAWIAALKNTTGPTALLLTRQNLPVIDRKAFPPADSLERGAYVLRQTGEGKPDAILIASGSEVSLALEAADRLADEMNVRVVSMPSWEMFEKQTSKYRKQVLPPACKTRLALEAGSTMGWEKYVGAGGRILGMTRFGASAPYAVLAEKFGFTADNVVSIVRAMAKRRQPAPAKPAPFGET